MRGAVAVLLFLGAGPARAFDHTHAAWSDLLRAHVRHGEVDYSALERDPRPLRAYLGGLESLTAAELAGFSREQKLALWINAYNAYTVKLIVDHHPIASIRKVGRIWQNPFKLEFIPLERLLGKAISLDTIEHEFLRKQLKDARIHAALVCAAKSCPELRAEAYRADDLDRQLDAAMRGFLADARKNRWDPAARVLHLSSIFKWFREDFEGEKGTLPGWLERFAPAAWAPAFAGPAPAEIDFLDYDWSLNGK